MNKKSYGLIFFGILLSAFVIYVCVTFKPVKKQIHEYYQVYLGGEKIGLIASADELYAKINEEQQDIKKQYGVNNVYSPQSLEVQKVSTYKTDLKSATEVYEEIKDLDPFTIEGYEVTIKYEDGTRKKLYILKKEDLDVAVKNTVLAFVDEDTYNKYLTGTQEEVVDEGVEITSIYFNDEITIKKAHISTEEKIFTNETDLSQYFLFGTNDIKKTYKVKSNDTLETIAYSNKLGVAETVVQRAGDKRHTK